MSATTIDSLNNSDMESYPFFITNHKDIQMIDGIDEPSFCAFDIILFELCQKVRFIINNAVFIT